MLPTAISDVSGDSMNCYSRRSNDDCRPGYYPGNDDESCDADASIGDDCGDGVLCNHSSPYKGDLDTAWNNNQHAAGYC